MKTPIRTHADHERLITSFEAFEAIDNYDQGLIALAEQAREVFDFDSASIMNSVGRVVGIMLRSPDMKLSLDDAVYHPTANDPRPKERIGRIEYREYDAPGGSAGAHTILARINQRFDPQQQSGDGFVYETFVYERSTTGNMGVVHGRRRSHNSPPMRSRLARTNRELLRAGILSSLKQHVTQSRRQQPSVKNR